MYEGVCWWGIKCVRLASAPLSSDPSYTHNDITTGRGFSTLSGKEGANAERWWGLEKKSSWNAVLALTGIIALMWEVMDRFHQAEVARIQDKAKAEMALIQDKAKAERGLYKLEMARIQDKAKAEMALIEDKAKAERGLDKVEAARFEDKADFYKYLLQLTGSHDYEPLKAMLEEARTGAAKGTDGGPKEGEKSDGKRGAGSSSS